jgi:hypothetical protein
MDCKNARLLLDFVRPNVTELEAGERKELQGHLNDCPDCAAVAGVERRLDEHLGRAVRDVPVPDGLRDRLLKRMAAERDAWYRRWLLRAVGVAAAAALVIWLGRLWWMGRVEGVNWPALSQQFSENIVTKEGIEKHIEKHYRDRGFVMLAPPRFNYTLLHSFDVVEFQGKRVPHLLFFHQGGGKERPAIAHVYVLSEHQFDLDKTKQTAESLQTGSLRVEVWRPRDNPHIAYVIIYTSEDLRPFLLPRAGKPV